MSPIIVQPWGAREPRVGGKLPQPRKDTQTENTVLWGYFNVASLNRFVKMFFKPIRHNEKQRLSDLLGDL